MANYVAILGSIMLVTSIAAGILAGVKRRDWSYWMTIAFLFPPAILLLVLMPKNVGPRPRRLGLEDQEREQLRREEQD